MLNKTILNDFYSCSGHFTITGFLVCVAVDIIVVKGCALHSFSFILQSDEVSFLQYYIFFVLPNAVN